MTTVRTEVVRLLSVEGGVDLIVRHDPSASFARSVIPCATRYFRTQVWPLVHGGNWTSRLTDDTERVGEDAGPPYEAGWCLSTVEFRQR